MNKLKLEINFTKKNENDILLSKLNEILINNVDLKNISEFMFELEQNESQSFDFNDGEKNIILISNETVDLYDSDGGNKIATSKFYIINNEDGIGTLFIENTNQNTATIILKTFAI